MNYKKLGDIVKFVSNKNVDGIATILYGINIDKFFMPSVANTIGVDLKKYKVVVKNQFACNRMHVGRDKRLPISMSTFDYPFIVSPAYDVFEVIDATVLPEYLMLWFRRSELDRQCWFYTDADVRGGLSLDALKSIEIEIPSIEKQREIVAQYQAVANKIIVNEQICEKLEATAQTLYKQWFVDFEFPCLPSSYRPHGQVNQNLPIDEYITKIGSVCTYSRVGGLPVSDGKTWFVYLILCENDSVYKGITNDLYRRFYEHYMGEGAEWTKLNKPLKVIHWESFATKEEAAKREKDLKTGYGRTWISRQIEKAGGIPQLKTSLPAPQTELRTAGKMVYNQELEKEIPEGWDEMPISNYINVNSGFAFKSDWWTDTGIPVIKIGTIKNNSIDDSELAFINKNNLSKSIKSFVDKGDIVIAMTGFTMGKIGLIPNINEKLYVNQRVGYFKTGNNELNNVGYLYCVLKTKEFQNQIWSFGGDSQQFNVSNNQVDSIKILQCSNKDIVNYFNNQTAPIFKRLIFSYSIINKLTQLQSLLLSRLATLEG
ncbi:MULTISPECIES: restriction endonuclease subunit S [unclassified Empedobacter]|uniref:restriction endonuclease subunit S n=1 Tax=unclassified Empedobacter TaxID=2643773 RepID=UPI0025BE48BF|nr:MULTISPECIES: restriction endonuclease subunit S [unclassified Empedobacter]